MMHRREVYEVHRLERDEIRHIASQQFYGDHAKATRYAITSSWTAVCRAHPSLAPGKLMVDITEGYGDHVRWVIHEGQHVPSVLTQPYTRRYQFEAWVKLQGVFA